MLIKIKTWKQMKKEFGTNKKGNINCKKIFTKNMEGFIPENRIIEIDKYDCWICNTDDDRQFYISNDMIEINKFYSIYGEPI